ncbi:hypothetical protein CLV45_1449 [Hymenobacter chitinivorans DSM 11115]|uniref:Uncharacterized protein n=1 Tax=Hymenobacter chitinivorans DSM 11115 TaxID=1121954 RepID=A0A2M9BPZ9_9BACT|nr:hypothetical protein CLV45_1449 [Hymenobacter chitinivorans DSM 11115]
MKKGLLLYAAAVFSIWIFHVLDYAYATKLKAPFYSTHFSEKRFVRFQGTDVTHIEYEFDGSELQRVNDGLNTIDMESFHRISNDHVADVQYRDKNYSYTIHDGEEKYIIRHKP